MEKINKNGYWIDKVPNKDLYELKIRLSWYYTDIFKSFNIFNFDKTLDDIDVDFSNIFHVYLVQDCEFERYKHLIHIYNELNNNFDCCVEFVHSSKNIFEFQLSKISLKCYLDEYDEYEFDDQYRTGYFTGNKITQPIKDD